MKRTEKISLDLFEGTDKFDYKVINENLQKIENEIDKKSNKMDLTEHVNNKNNPHGVTKSQVELGNVDNTSDIDKPISNAQQQALNAKANQTDLTAHTNNADIHVTASDKTNWNNATDKINNLEVGGTNLLTGTRDFTGGWSYVGNAPIQDDDNDSFKCFRLINSFSNFVRHYITLKQDDYILSFYAKSDKTEAICIKDDLTNAEVGYVTIDDSEWKKYSIGIPRTLVITDISFLTRQNDTPIYIKKIKLEKGNVATDWTPAPEDKIEISDVNGLQDIADNTQIARLDAHEAGWYRIAEYAGSHPVNSQGSAGNGVEIFIKRAYNNTANEMHKLLLQSYYSKQKFSSIASSSYDNCHIINKIRYVISGNIAYIDIYYSISLGNQLSVILNNCSDMGIISWKAIESPYLVAESVEGETVSTVFDIPANASPITTADSLMVKTIDVDASYFYNMSTQETGNMYYDSDSKKAHVYISETFFATYGIDASKVLAFAFKAVSPTGNSAIDTQSNSKNFAWNPFNSLIQNNTGNFYSWVMEADKSGASSDTSTSYTPRNFKMLYMA